MTAVRSFYEAYSINIFVNESLDDHQATVALVVVTVRLVAVARRLLL